MKFEDVKLTNTKNDREILPRTSVDRIFNKNTGIFLDEEIENMEIKSNFAFENSLKQKFFNELEQIGIVYGEETIEDIALKLPAHSTIIYHKGGTRPSDVIYPSRTGTVTVTKVKAADKVSFLFQNRNEYSFGYYDITNPGGAEPWSGWKAVSSYTVYTNYGDMGLPAKNHTIDQIYNAMKSNSSAIIQVSSGQEDEDIMPLSSGILRIYKTTNRAEFNFSNKGDEVYFGEYNENYGVAWRGWFKVTTTKVE